MEQKLQNIIGSLVMQLAQAQAQIETLQAQIDELKSNPATPQTHD